VPGVIASQAFSCNNPYQPSITVNTTANPQFMTLLASAYDRVYVKRSWIVVQVVNSTMADALAVVLSYDGNPVVSSDIDELAETNYAQSRFLGYFSGGNTTTTFAESFTPERNLGIPANSAENVCLGGTPADAMYWIVSVKPLAASTGNVAYRVKIAYELVFSELKAPTP